MALLITITNAGRAEMIAAENTGTEKVTIVSVAFGTGLYTPSKSQTALQAEFKRVSSIAGAAVADDTIHVVAKDESSAAYNVGEFGLISDKGTLIAVYSQLAAAGWILQKGAASTLLLATDIILESLDASVIQFGDISFINPPATETTPGVVTLVDNLTTNNPAAALTAAMGKKLQDEKEPAIAAGTTSQYWRGNKGWRDFATDVRAAVLTGLSTASNTAIAAADSVLGALGKLQAQVTGLATSKLDATANAVSASKLATARNINGVAFDGTANITIAAVDASKEPAIAAGTTAQYWRGDKTWRDLATDVRTTVLTGLSIATATAIVAADSVLVALGKLQAQVTGLATSKLDATANAVSASKLLTGRTIGGVVFDGTANINLPGVNQAGTQNTTGNAATATKLATARTIGGVAFDGTANINLPGVNQAGTQNTTGNAATATKLATARTINGVAFDGTANITIAAVDASKEPAIAAGTTAQYWRGDKTWRDFATDVRATVLTGLSTATATAIVAADSVLVALGKLQAQVNTKLDATANAVSASKLLTARTIGGVAFDGTANINLPGVNQAGTQNTTGNAATATKLAAARNINGVAFDGTANITIADATKQPSDATLTALAALNTAANQIIYSTGADAFALATLTPFMRTLLDDANAAAALATLGITATVTGTATNYSVTLTGGLILKFGTFTKPAGTYFGEAELTTITFTDAFPGACLWGGAFPGNSAGIADAESMYLLYSKTKSNGVIWAEHVTGPGMNGREFHWFFIGN